MRSMLSPVRQIAAILAGGFVGTLLRLGLSTLITTLVVPSSFPLDLVVINLTGAFLLAFVTVLAEATIALGPTRRLFLSVGVLGAYTTWSSLALGDVLLFAQGQIALALLYLMVSLIGGMLAVFLGELLGQHWVEGHMMLFPGKIGSRDGGEKNARLRERSDNMGQDREHQLSSSSKSCKESDVP